MRGERRATVSAHTHAHRHIMCAHAHTFIHTRMLRAHTHTHIHIHDAEIVAGPDLQEAKGGRRYATRDKGGGALLIVTDSE